MNDWSIVTLKDVCSNIQYGYTDSASKDPIGPKFLRITDIVGEIINWEKVPYVNIEGKEFEKYKLNKGDIVVARTGNTTGYAKLIRHSPDCVFASYLIRFVVDKEKGDSGFIGRLIESNIFKDYVWSILGGSAQPGANAQFLSSFKFHCPPLPIQRKISSILSCYDDLFENNLKRIKLLEEFAQRTFENWFVDFHRNYKVNDHTGLPEGWKKETLGQVTEFLARGISPKYVEEGGITVINQKCVRDGIITLDQSRLTSSETKFPKEKYLQVYDIIVNSTGAGTLGRVAQVTNLDREMTTDTHVSIIRANKKAISPILLGFSIKSQEDLITGMGKGATNQLELSRNDLRDLVTVVVPDADSQKKFDLLIEPLLKQISNLSIQNRKLRETRDILLPRLMSGVIDVSRLEEQELSIAAEPSIKYSKC